MAWCDGRDIQRLCDLLQAENEVAIKKRIEIDAIKALDKLKAGLPS